MKLVPLAPPGRRRKKKINRHATMILVAIMLVLLVLGWRVLPVISNGLASTAPVHTGFIEECWHGDGLLVRDESITLAPVGGWLHLKVAQGERVRVGNVIATIEDDEGRLLHTFTAKQAGIVSYQIDGMEHLQPDEPMVKVWTQLRALRIIQRNMGDRVEVDEPVFKIIDTLSTQLYVAIKGEHELTVGGQVRVTLQDTQVFMQVRKVEQQGDSILALLYSDQLPSMLCDYRYLPHLLVSRGRHYGAIVPTSSIVTDEKERTAVYLMVDRRPVYMRVQVIVKNKEEAVVSGLPIGGRVARRPGRLWVYKFPW